MQPVEDPATFTMPAAGPWLSPLKYIESYWDFKNRTGRDSDLMNNSGGEKRVSSEESGG